jgi:DNA-directed RNA polymerase subunit alpha
MLWKGFQKPKRLEVDRDSLTDLYGRFYAQPFERGFATTVGNALRRVLLSSIEGAAVTAVRVEGVLHEFSPIPGAMEDTTDLILNLKRVPLKMHVDHPKTLLLRTSEPGEVRAKDITADPDVEVLDPEAYIATLGAGASLGGEMRVTRTSTRTSRSDGSPSTPFTLRSRRSTTSSSRRAWARRPTTRSSPSRSGRTARCLRETRSGSRRSS